MKICAEEARRLKLKIEFRILMEKMKKRFLDFLAQYEVYGYLKKRWCMDLVEEFVRLEKALKWKIYYFIGYFGKASTLGVFFFKQYASGPASTNF